MVRRSKASIAALMLFGALTACDDPAEPAPSVSIHVAHAAPGVGAHEVAVDGAVLAGALTVGQHVAETVTAGEHFVTVGGADLNVGLYFDDSGEEALAAVIMRPQAPTVRAYRNTGTGSGARFVLINAVPDTALWIFMDAGATRMQVADLVYADTVATSLTPDDYAVSVHAGDPAEAVDLGEVRLPQGRSFVVLYPNPDGAVPWDIRVF